MPRVASSAVTPAATEDHVVVIQALGELPFPQRETMALFYFGDLSVEDIAATLGVAVGTVKSRLNRGRAAIAPLLATSRENDRE